MNWGYSIMKQSSYRNIKIGDVLLDIESGVSVNSTNSKATENQYGVLKTGCVKDGFFVPIQNKTILEDELKRAKLNPKKNTIILNRSNTQELVGMVGYIEKDFPDLFLSDKLWSISVNENIIDTRFLTYLLLSKKYSKKISDIATGTSGTMKNISQKAFNKIEIRVPTIAIQKKITNLLATLDLKIQKQNEKVEFLKAQKKGLMQKIFNQGLRFKDENGQEYPEWEKASIKQLFDLYSSGDLDKNLLAKESNSKFKYPVYGNALTNNGLLGYYEEYKEESNAVTITARGDIGKPYYRVTPFNAVGRLIVLRLKNSEFSMEFFYVAISMLKIFKETTGVPQLTVPGLSVYTLPVASKAEQKYIGNLFMKFDAKISLEESKFIELQKQKQAFMQQMFI